MSTGSGDEERAWAADKREFVADRRDEVADERDRVADTRDRTADDREAELDKWERQLDARAAELSGTAEDSGASAERAESRAGRSQARQNRDEAQAKRTIAAADRDESTKRRQADAPPTRLARVFADIAEQLYNANSFDDVLLRIANAAVSTIAGCRMASVTLCERSGYRTAASTDPAATAVDHAQYQSHEGPCLDAVDAPMVYAQSFPDERWPTLASRSDRVRRTVGPFLPPGRGEQRYRRLRRRIPELLRRHSECVQRHCAGDWTHLGRARLGGGPGG